MRGQGERVWKLLYRERSRPPRKRDCHNIQRKNCYCGGEKRKETQDGKRKKEEGIKKKKIVRDRQSIAVR